MAHKDGNTNKRGHGHRDYSLNGRCVCGRKLCASERRALRHTGHVGCIHVTILVGSNG